MKVSFHNQSNLAVVMGILIILGSFGIFAIPMGGYGGQDIILKFAMFIISILFGISLIKLGARKVPDYDEFFAAIENLVKKEPDEVKDEPPKEKDESKS